MRHRIPVAALLVLAVVSATADAAPGAAAQREIDGLMQALEDSGCRFQRNGTWYPASDARSHLQRKYDYLLKRDQADTAEQFIERAASRSSMSGKSYRVSCPGHAEQDSVPWFQQQLVRLRGH